MRIGKKGSSLVDLLLVMTSIILIVFAVRTGLTVAEASGFSIGEHQKEIFAMISEGDKIQYYFDELSRQSLIRALDKTISNPADGACGKYAGYDLLNKETMRCGIDKKERLMAEAKSYFLEQSKKSGSTFETSFKEEAGQLLFLGRADEKELKFDKGTYTIIPSFETRLAHGLDEFDEFDSAIQKLSACRTQDCLSETAKSQSSPALKFEVGNCEEHLSFANLAEDIIDCASSKDNGCTCAVGKSPVKQDYTASLSNEGDSLKIEISNNNADQILLSGIKIDKPFSIDFGLEKYLLKSNGVLSLTGMPKNQCTIDKTKYRLCAKTDKYFYIYDEAKKKIEKKQLIYKFALEIKKETSASTPAQPAAQDTAQQTVSAESPTTQ